MNPHRSRPGGRRGQSILLLSVALVPLVGLMGLVVDLGWMRFLQKSAQLAADAAALATISHFHSTVGGSSFHCAQPGVVCQAPTPCPATISTPQNSLEHGCLYAQQNGFSTANTNQNVTIQADVTAPPPTAPGVNSAAYWVTVRVTQNVPQLFSAVLGFSNGTIAARATAAIAPALDCVWALDPAASGAVTVKGTASFTSQCGIYVDSNSSSALITTGSAVLSAPEYDVVGGVSVSTPLSPAPNLGIAPAPDPLAGLPAPPVPSGCDYTDYKVKGWETATLSPGVYCGGINIDNGTANFSPGIYILKGGGLTTQNANSNASGSNVMFYNTYDGTYPYGPISLAATSSVSFSAPITGTYAGILFFQDRSVTGNPSESFQGGSTAKFEGTIYEPKSNITFSGNASLNAAYTIIVANQVSLVGNSSFKSDFSSLVGGTPIKQVALVE